MTTTPAPTNSPAPSIVTNAQTLVERGQTDRALRLLANELKRPSPREDALPFFLTLASTHPDQVESRRIIENLLTDAHTEMSFPVRAVLSDDFLSSSLVAFEDSRAIVTSLFDAALLEDDADWTLLQTSAIEQSVREELLPPFEGFSLAATLLFVPATLGWRNVAIQTVVLASRRAPADQALIRDAERLLHAIGEPAQAYELERERKQRFIAAGSDSESPTKRQSPSLGGLSIAIAGGHAGFRSMFRLAMIEEGGSVTEIPPRFEAVRRERDVLDAMSSADVAVVITSQIAHSTSDQVVRSGKRLGVPVLFAPTASVSSLLRMVVDWRSASQAASD